MCVKLEGRTSWTNNMYTYFIHLNYTIWQKVNFRDIFKFVTPPPPLLNQTTFTSFDKYLMLYISIIKIIKSSSYPMSNFSIVFK